MLCMDLGFRHHTLTLALTNGITHQFDKEKETGMLHARHLSCVYIANSVRNFGFCQEKQTGMPHALHLSCVVCQLNKSSIY